MLLLGPTSQGPFLTTHSTRDQRPRDRFGLCCSGRLMARLLPGTDGGITGQVRPGTSPDDVSFRLYRLGARTACCGPVILLQKTRAYLTGAPSQ